MTGGQAVVRALEANGVEVVFGIPGTHNLPVIDALLDSRIRFVQVRHEQAAAYMADGYARVSGRPGVAVTITGPGALNAAAGVATAYFDSSPVLVVSSTVPAVSLYRRRGALHETKDQLASFAAVAGWAGRAAGPDEVPWAIGQAFRAMTNGRPLPAYVEVPSDVLAAEADLPEAFPPATGARVSGDPEAIVAAAAAIRRGAHPAIWAGGGVNRSGAANELVALAELLGAPVVTTTQGRGAIPGDHPLAITAHPSDRPVREWLATADPLVAVGTRFTQEATASWRAALPRNLVHIDIDPGSIGKNYPAGVGVIGDARLVLAQLLEALLPVLGTRGQRRGEAREVNAEAAGYYRDRMPREMAIAQEIRAATPREAIIASDATRVGYWATMIMPFYGPRSLVYPSYHTVGGGFPTALGARIGAPDRPVLAMVGDGGFQYSFAELATVRQYGIDIVVLLVNDRSYGIVAEGQRKRFGREAGVDLSTNPDFGMLVRSYGLSAVRLERWHGIGAALRDAFAAGGFRLIEVCEGILTPPWSWSE